MRLERSEAVLTTIVITIDHIRIVLNTKAIKTASDCFELSVYHPLLPPPLPHLVCLVLLFPIITIDLWINYNKI